ncbi:MAG: SulP family inorganic anion transporter [Steroidobacteraceae bacterium]
MVGSRGTNRPVGAGRTTPQGLPIPTIPFIHFDDISSVLIGGLAVALVSFADTSVLSRVYAARLRTPVSPNQEMIALGVANFAAGFFPGFSNQQQLIAHPGRRGPPEHARN